MAFWNRPAPENKNPRVRREKSYTALTGYVYRYSFVEVRHSARGEVYVFTVAHPHPQEVCVLMPAAVVNGWMKSKSRTLSDPEKYGLVKLKFFSILDDTGNPNQIQPSEISTEDLDHSAKTLDLL